MHSLLTWNILHGGGNRRTPRILLSLLELQADVMVITEYRTTLGGQVRGILADHGWEHQACTEPGPRRNGILIASRTPLRAKEAAVPACFAGKWLEAHVPALGLSVLGVHVPEVRHGDRKVQAWTYLEAFARSRRGDSLAIIGDLNTGRSVQDEEAPVLTCSQFMGRLWTLGYRDPWREFHPQGREFSWYSHEGTGVRIDHALLSPALWPRARGARYCHDVRERAESDHSALIVEVAPRAEEGAGADAAADEGGCEPREMSLF